MRKSCCPVDKMGQFTNSTFLHGTSCAVIKQNKTTGSKDSPRIQCGFWTGSLAPGKIFSTVLIKGML